jgi:hypothetical protein
MFQQRELELREDMEHAMQEKDKKWQRDITEERTKNEATIKKSFAEVEALKTNMKKIAEEKDAQYRALQAEMARQRQQYQHTKNIAAWRKSIVAREKRLMHVQHERGMNAMRE